MSEDVPVWRQRQSLILFGAVAAAAIAGGVIGRGFVPTTASTGGRRPIIQLARSQSLPSLADSVAKLCPAVAAIVPHGVSMEQKGQGFLISTDGWLVFSAGSPDGPFDALFGDGRRVPISDIRPDPVSGLAVARVDTSSSAGSLTLSDQSFPRIGDFGFALQSPAGSGCSAMLSMIGSDFLVDGGGQAIFIRLQQSGTPLAAGSPFFGSDGRVIGIAEGGAGNALVPAPIAAIIIDELIRGRPSPLLAYGFRAVDLSPELANRLGDVRTRGVAVAIVQPRSNVDRAGLKAGDVVAAVDSSPISSASELSRALDAVTTSATLTVIRGNQQLSLKVSRSLD